MPKRCPPSRTSAAESRAAIDADPPVRLIGICPTARKNHAVFGSSKYSALATKVMRRRRTSGRKIESQNEMWLLARIAGPESGMFSMPSTRTRQKNRSTGVSRSLSTQYAIAPDGTRGDSRLLDRAVKCCQPLIQMERRLTARGKERRQQLMDYAAARFAEGGYHPTSVAEIVQGLGVGKGVFYWYFDSKEQLFLEILKDAQHDLRRAQQHAIEDEPDPLRRIELGIRASMTWFAEHRDLVNLFQFAAT